MQLASQFFLTSSLFANDYFNSHATQFGTQKYKKTNPEKYSEMQQELAITLRDKILALGPTFIKLGQLLSTRIDVLPQVYINALAVLQDKVPGFSGDVAVQIIEEQFGKPITELYDTFNTESIAAASLGQVHLAQRW